MKKMMIWDVPIRIFHVAFGFCCASSLAIALLADEDSAIFPWHMLLGIAACFLLLVRVALALFGSRHNRLKPMLFSPVETLRYAAGIVTGKAMRYPVHNPGTATAAAGMFFLVPLLLWTGLNGGGEADIHEILAYALLALILAHLIGLMIHTVRYRENIALSMVTGLKQSSEDQGLRSSNLLGGVVVLAISAAWIGSLFSSYNADKAEVTLPVLGNTIQLGERESDDHNRHSEMDDD